MYSFGYGNDRPIPRLGAFNPLNIEGLSLYMNKNLGVNTKLAADFNGTTQYLSSPSTDFDFTTESFTLGGWFKWTTTTDDFAFFNKWNGTGSQRGFICYKNNSDNLSFRISANGTGLDDQLTTTTSYAINTWHYVAFVKDAVNGLIKISVNGQAFSSAVSTNSVFNSNEDLIIGFTYAANYLDGAADGLNIYNKALSTAELKALYNLGNGIAYDKLPTLVGEQYAIGQYFNGTTDAFNIDAVLPTLASTTTGTWEFDVEPTTTTSASSRKLLNFGDADVSTFIQCDIWTSGQIFFRCNNAGANAWRIETDNAVVSAGVSVNVKVVQDGTLPKIYINGVLVAQTTTISTDLTIWFNDLPLLDNGRIADANWNGTSEFGWLDGTVQNVKIYSDDTQTTLVANYPMNNVEGADQVDIVGGYNATPIGLPQSRLASVDNTTIGDMKTNLISWWELNEASGIRYDSVLASANNLTDNNSVGYTLGKIQAPTEVGEAVSQWVDQSPNMFVLNQDTVTAMSLLSANSVDFDGVDDYLLAPVSDAFIADSSGIIFFSIYFDGTNSGFILTSADTASFNSLFYLSYGSSGKLNLLIRNSAGTSTSVNSLNDLSVGFNYGYCRSDGSSTYFKVNSNSENAATGTDNGNWFSFSDLRDNIVFGASVRSIFQHRVNNYNKIIYSNANLSASVTSKIGNFMSDPNN